MSNTVILILLAMAISIPAFAQNTAPPASQSAEKPPYTVVDGNKVDPNTLEGWHTWRAMACDRCHGAKQEGATGPPLIDSLKHMTMEEFKKAVLEGRPEKGMPNYNTTKLVVDNIDNLYTFLKGRSDGAISPGHLYPAQK
jgi:mono/diheme cytochrome c family protein